MQTEFIVLKKTPFKENAVILTGLSPDCGKLEVIAYGANGCAKNNNAPAADLYQVIAVNLNDRDLEKNNNAIPTAHDIELMEFFPELPRKIDNLKFVARIAGFLLRNTTFESPLPLVYDAMKNALRALNSNQIWNQRETAVIIKLTFLYENGLLPEPENMDSNSVNKIMAMYEKIIECAVDGEPLPEISGEYYSKLDAYLNSLIKQNQLPWR